jgi:hypothetical protein
MTSTSLKSWGFGSRNNLRRWPFRLEYIPIIALEGDCAVIRSMLY